MFESQLSETLWEIFTAVYEKFEYTLKLRSQFMQQRAQLYASAISAERSPLYCVFGFIDCTKIKMCIQGVHNSFQRSVYNGDKKMHSLIYQTISTPDGLIFTMYGTGAGRLYDMFLYHNNGWDQIFQQTRFIDGLQFYVFGEKAYMIRPWMRQRY